MRNKESTCVGFIFSSNVGGFALVMASEDLNIGKIRDGEPKIKIDFTAIR